MTNASQISPYMTGLGCKCPRCGQGALYQGYLALAENCTNCGLDYQKADSGDGPAVFAIFLVGFTAIAIAFIARFSWDTPIWLAFLISAGFAIFLTLSILRPLKAFLIALQYANKAGNEEMGDISQSPSKTNNTMNIDS